MIYLLLIDNDNHYHLEYIIVIPGGVVGSSLEVFRWLIKWLCPVISRG
jgi:hypothetical protein